MAKRRTEVHTGVIEQAKAKSLPEYSNDQGIEPIAEKDFVKAAELEKFMHDMVTIVVAVGRDPSDNPVVVPSVNGVNQPIIRGVPVTVKRKYLEALARCTVTKYKQEEPNPQNPDQLNMSAFASAETPFTVIDAPAGSVGIEWITAIMKQAAIA